MADKLTNSQILLLFSNLLLLTVAANTAYPIIPGTGGSDCSLSDDLTPIRREVYDGGRIFDISHRYTTNMPTWEKAEGLGQFLWLPSSIKNGSLANNSEMKLPTHTGTHVDAPGHVFDHYFDAGFDVDTLDLEVLNGPALLVDVPRDKNITADVMESLHIPRGVRRVLFRTLNTDRKLMFKKEFDTSYVGFMKDGARWLLENTDIKLVGIDYLSVAAYDDLLPSHYVFLEGREIILVEGLKLDDIPAGMYSMHSNKVMFFPHEAVIQSQEVLLEWNKTLYIKVSQLNGRLWVDGTAKIFSRVFNINLCPRGGFIMNNIF
ncbi:hypothetical protein LWI29_038545 [Acer saccharum]|uniref:Uncharacterized protein n=1 Tax=Acer saccharum TaxID=4024 RepID=A0AA39S1Y5_ACESA|nr:hypothetical protein LWI29_038545 [Acer saccharum]